MEKEYESPVRPEKPVRLDAVFGMIMPTPHTKQEKDDYDHLIEAAFMTKPSKVVYQFKKAGSATHISVVHRSPGDFLILANNSDGFIEVIKDDQSFAKIDIGHIHCSHVLSPTRLIIGSRNKLHLVDLQTFKVLSVATLQRHIFSVCAANNKMIVCGEQGGQLAAVTVDNDDKLNLVAENKVSDAIYKVIRTT